MKEYRDLTADPLQGTITAGPIDEDNMLEWEALIQGPEGTPYVCSIPLLPALLPRLFIWNSSLGKGQKGGLIGVVWCKRTVLMFLRRVVCFAPSSNS